MNRRWEKIKGMWKFKALTILLSWPGSPGTSWGAFDCRPPTAGRPPTWRPSSSWCQASEKVTLIIRFAQNIPKLLEWGWAFQPALENKSINSVTTKNWPVALKRRSCDAISQMHCLTSLKIVVELWCLQGTFGATCLCLLFWSAQPYSINFRTTKFCIAKPTFFSK